METDVFFETLKQDNILNVRDYLKDNPTEHPFKFDGYDTVTSMIEILYTIKAHTKAESMYKFSRLHLAARYGNIEYIKFLLESGESINCKDVFGYTPLHYAIERPIERGGDDIVQFLIRNCIDDESSGIAVHKGKESVNTK